MAGKTIWAISVFSSDDAAEAAPLFECLRRSADYMKMGWGGKVLGQGNRPGDVLADHRSVAAARMRSLASATFDLLRQAVGESSLAVGLAGIKGTLRSSSADLS